MAAFVFFVILLLKVVLAQDIIQTGPTYPGICRLSVDTYYYGSLFPIELPCINIKCISSLSTDEAEVRINPN
jgi:hypothetical protein